ncbi:hypothetical protein KGQ20_39850 [Catenulispora sp. NF23]|uniref:hypothetical protein n=1 Tax=Catenulispora pinistramenti TaxID=2705254 RepID=UPI001BAAB77C|nr:hypothetical protein [Catenulispora pinistramenti]MBS2538919.1 hypothetical protein [Catenulispora pinistramenti]
MALITRVTPRLDAAPEHTCGTAFRAGVITVGCPGCQRHTAAGTPVLVHGRGLR